MGLEWIFLQPLTWNWALIFALLMTLLIYLFLLYQFQTPVNRKQIFFMTTGIALLGITSASPLTSFAHLTFSTHMIQMSILYFVIPPLLLLGIPPILFQKLLRVKMVGYKTSVISLVLFSVLFLMYHLPVILQIISQYSILQKSYSILLFVLAIIMWSPFVSWQENELKIKRYALISNIIVMPACLMFIVLALFAGIDSYHPLNAQLFAQLCLPSAAIDLPVNTKVDQVMAGVVMLGIHKVATHLTVREKDLF
ncbi:cytochrome c oxidase assembly protein [Gracilibacillus salinarum]|uniref:Cytochrome c oxidase assembly protein n=1 Tax=Gracilibacillus salinarum TaxID=2932255 RepID=A0ABY4GIP5_9BACI|nr:cytochrome c oxidase assembly protein [Gracilibacillus salinarum]UOQ84078.1 cytochrome c oxidase assembly protein [Gracilibacillus salinarum]